MIADQLEQFFPDLKESTQIKSPTRSIHFNDPENTLKTIVQTAAQIKRQTRTSLLITAGKYSHIRRSAAPTSFTEDSFMEEKEEIEENEEEEEVNESNRQMQSPKGHTRRVSAWESIDSTETIKSPTRTIDSSRIVIDLPRSDIGDFEQVISNLTKRVSTIKVKTKRPLINQWTQGQLIGQGAFGKVFHGLNLENGDIMAVKQVLIGSVNDAQKTKREDALRREMELFEEMDNAYIVRYLGKYLDNDERFYF